MSRRPERVNVLAEELPRRVAAAIVRAIDAGDDADLQQLQEMEALVVATRQTVSGHLAAPADNGDPAPRA